MTYTMLDRKVEWPNGHRCAASVSFDVDLDSMLELTHGSDARKRMSGRSWLRYDEVAVPRILRLYRDLGIKQTFFFPGWCIENYRHLVERCRLRRCSRDRDHSRLTKSASCVISPACDYTHTRGVRHEMRGAWTDPATQALRPPQGSQDRQAVRRQSHLNRSAGDSSTGRIAP